MLKGATFSPCMAYRYTLTRTWDARSPAVFIGLNPSTADASIDDPTIRRCIRFAATWSCGGMIMLNLFAYRATDPKAMLDAPDPIGPDNDAALLRICKHADLIVAAWGTHGTHQGRAERVIGMLDGRLSALRITKHGHPAHPLYLPAVLEPMPWK